VSPKKQADMTFQDGTFFLTGDVDFFNVMSLYQQSLPQINLCQALHFDFSGLKSSDSSGLALIIEWIKLAKKQNKPIRYSHLSQDILSLAKISGLDQLIDLDIIETTESNQSSISHTR
jgi:phospholipid transport system transporter-binding protein